MAINKIDRNGVQEAPSAGHEDGKGKASRATAAKNGALDFRSAIEIADSMGELVRIKREVDPLIEIPAVLRACGRLKPVPAILFDNVLGYAQTRVVGNLFSDEHRFFRMCGFTENEKVSKFSFLDALENPIEPVVLNSGPCQENVIYSPVAVEDHIPPTHGALMVTRKYYQPVVFLKHPQTGVVNMSIYRACIQPDGRLTSNIRWDQHGGLYLKRAMELGRSLPIAMCIGVPPAVYLAAVSKLPYGYTEPGFAGGILGKPLEMVKCKTVDLEVPATAEIVVEGEIRPPYERGDDGPWPEYLGYLGMEVHPPIVDVTCLTYRNNFVENMLVPGSAPHMLAIGTLAEFYRFLRLIFGEFVVDSTFAPRTSGHSGIIKVRKTEAHHEGLQMNVALAAFGFSNSLDKVTVVDDDININDLAEVEWAMATRCDPAKQVHILPNARTHQNNPIAGVQEVFDEPICKAKLVIDATIPWRLRQVQKGKGITFFTKSEWPKANLSDYLEPNDRERFRERQ